MFSKIFSLFVAAIQLLLGLFGLGLPAQPAEPKDCYPIVFVHGLGGWGEGALLNDPMPHWGMLAGSVKALLNSQGYEAHAASVGPVSSAWDRACELYAHITGTRVDYGAAHSAEHNHARYGQCYAQALVPDWSAEKKINLIGHSFGGVTVRLLAQLCGEGSAAELAAAGDTSPLFTGELNGFIASVTTLAAPHNGSSSLSLGDEGESVMSIQGSLQMVMYMGQVFPVLNKFYPFRLEHFGMSSRDLRRDPFGTIKNSKAFNSGNDRAEIDLSVDGAYAVNQTINCQQDVCYFSYAAKKTQADADGNQVPEDGMWSFFKDVSAKMGQKRDPITTACGIVIDDSWLPNDGLVNVVSALYPFGEAHKDYDAENIEAGIWQVMPLLDQYDHMDFTGGMRQLGGTPGIRDFYLGLAALLEQVK